MAGSTGTATCPADERRRARRRGGGGRRDDDGHRRLRPGHVARRPRRRRPHAGVHATVGLHPHEARHGVDTIGDLFDGAGRPVAVGECGLDYHYDHSPRDAQREAFAAQIALAHERGLPLVIHTREAWDDTFDILDAEGVPARTIFHCFTGGPDEARRCLDAAPSSASPASSRSRRAEVREAARARAARADCWSRPTARTSRPVPHRGKRNRPAWVPLVGARLADVHGVAVDAIRDATRRHVGRRSALDG